MNDRYMERKGRRMRQWGTEESSRGSVCEGHINHTADKQRVWGCWEGDKSQTGDGRVLCGWDGGGSDKYGEETDGDKHEGWLSGRWGDGNVWLRERERENGKRLEGIYKLNNIHSLNGCGLLSSYTKKIVMDIGVLESIQRQATKLINAMENLTYDERLKNLSMFSLERKKMS